MLKRALSLSADLESQQVTGQITPQTIFNNPSVRQLANHLVSLSGELTNSNEQSLELLGTKSTIMDSMILRYTQNMHVRLQELAWSDTNSEPIESVVLTGTTGALGSHLLAQLLANDKVQRIWALNRPHKGSTLTIKQRQHAAFEDKMLPVGLLDHSKLTFLECSLDQTRLGLPENDYEKASVSYANPSTHIDP
jgi:hypothetical protein